MEKILFIAYQFPPRGGAGVQRSTQLVKYLRGYGYDPVVLTVREEDVKSGGYQYDTTLLDQLPRDLTIVRTPSHEPTETVRTLMKWKLYRLAWFFRFGKYWEQSAQWPDKVFPVAAELVKTNNIRLVYTTSGPFSPMLLGKRLKEELGVKWVADLRDPYTDAYMWDFPSKMHWKRQRKFEQDVFTHADKLILNTPEVRKLYISRGLTTEDRSICITNGY
jgi:hypothetical protein